MYWSRRNISIEYTVNEKLYSYSCQKSAEHEYKIQFASHWFYSIIIDCEYMIKGLTLGKETWWGWRIYWQISISNFKHPLKFVDLKLPQHQQQDK